MLYSSFNTIFNSSFIPFFNLDFFKFIHNLVLRGHKP